MHNNSFYYAQLDENNFCFALSSLSGERIDENLVRLDGPDDSYMGRKYDKENKVWLNEYRPKPVPVKEVTLKDISNDIQPISKVTQMTSEDALTIIEYLTIIDEKLNKLIKN